MKKLLTIFLSAFLSVGLLAGCGSGKAADTENTAPVSAAVGEETKQSESETDIQAETKEDKSDQVASADEMTDVVKVAEDGMVAIEGKNVKDGVYPVTVSSSSSMFNIVQCVLTVKDGQMTAVMTMSGTGYLKLFMGTGLEAVEASEDMYIPYMENDEGAYTFEVPVEALDKEINCAAFSKRKEKWYDRVLLFRADSLPAEAFADGMMTSPESLKLDDGEYTVEVQLEGGSGKASIESPAKLKVENGKAYAVIVWGSSNYDYMKVGGEKFDMINTDGNSVFEIPVSVFDWNIAVLADTTAMGQPHEIAYTLKFDSESIKVAD